MTQSDTRRLLTSQEAREQLGIGETKLYKLVEDGHLIPVRLPTETGKRREFRFEQSEIDSFIERNRAS